MLEVEFLDIVPQPTAFSVIIPGMGFLRDIMTRPFVVHWKIRDGWATSAEIPGVRIPGARFMGISGVAPSAQKLKEWTEREQRALDAGAFVVPPGEAGAVPGGRCGIEGLRTIPPRENGGNFDVKQLTEGAKLLLPVGALFSTGDAHFAQGDGEVCITAVEERPSPSASRYTRAWRREEPSPARCVHAQRLLCRSQDCRAPQFSWCYGHADQ